MAKDKKEKSKKSKEVEEKSEKSEEEVVEEKTPTPDVSDKEEVEHKQPEKTTEFTHGYAKCLDYDMDEFKESHKNMTIKDMTAEDILKYLRCVGKDQKNRDIVDGCEITLKKMNGDFKFRSARRPPPRNMPMRPQFGAPFAPQPFQMQQPQMPRPFGGPGQQRIMFPGVQQMQQHVMPQMGNGRRPFYQRDGGGMRPERQQERNDE